MPVIDTVQPWYEGEELTIVTPESENNVCAILDDGTAGDHTGLAHGTRVRVVELRPLQFTDVQTRDGKKYRMLANSYLQR